MQLLILGNPLETASTLGQKRLSKQISVCDRMIKDIQAGRITKSLEAFQSHLWWLQMYCNALDFYQKGYLKDAEEMSYFAERYKPAFITDAMIMRNRAKIKDGY